MPVSANREPFPDWRRICPELAVLESHAEEVREELEQLIGDKKGWFPWVQPHLFEDPSDWEIFTLYGMDKINVDGTARVPVTSELLAQIPGLEVAIFSRLRAGQSIHPHEGAPQLSNFVLRCHLGLIVPPGCGIGCAGEERMLEERKLLMFDDLHEHYAFNPSDRDRYVLLVDVARPLPHPLDIERPLWGVGEMPEWPPGWERVSAQGHHLRATSFRAGLDAARSMTTPASSQ